jgi:hypothetical protein
VKTQKSLRFKPPTKQVAAALLATRTSLDNDENGRPAREHMAASAASSIFQ